jgi:hypothetical protein
MPSETDREHGSIHSSWSGLRGGTDGDLVDVDGGGSAVRPDADPPLLCILVCGVAATAEKGHLDAGQRRALLQVIVSGTLS